MDNPRITLAIFGNQHSNSGFQPLYWINNPIRQLDNPLPPGMGKNPYFFVVETGPKHTQYTLVENNVSSFDGTRAGVLKMAIGIPNGYRLSNESPMNVLLEIRRTFLSQCMTQKSSITVTRNFKDELPDGQIFKNILDRYRLVRSYEQVCPMQGTEDAVMLLSPAEIEAFFINVHYPEFAAFRKLVVGETGNTEFYAKVISGLPIPRPFAPAPAEPQPEVHAAKSPSAPNASPKPHTDAPKKKAWHILLPIVQYVVVPLLAFLFGIFIVYIVSLFIH